MVGQMAKIKIEIDNRKCSKSIEELRLNLVSVTVVKYPNEIKEIYYTYNKKKI